MAISPPLLAATISSALFFGLVIALVGSLRTYWAERFELGDARADGLWTWLNWGLIPSMLLSGFLVDLWGLRPALWTGSLVSGMGLVFLGTSGRIGAIRGSLLLTSFGIGLLGTGSIVAMPTAFFGPREATAALNLGMGLFVVGALLAPVLCDIGLRTLGYRKLLLILGVLALLPAVFAIGIQSRASVPNVEEFKSASTTLIDLVLDPIVIAAAIVLFFYAPLEGTLPRWSTAYFKDLGHEESSARTMISGFWTTFMISRLLTSSILHTKGLQVLPANWDPWVLLACGIFVMVTLGNMMGTASRVSAGMGFLLLGFFLGPVFPTMVGMLYTQFPTSPGTAFGAMFALGSFGGVILGPIVSADSRRADSAQKAMRFPLAMGILLMVAALVFTLFMDRPT